MMDRRSFLAASAAATTAFQAPTVLASSHQSKRNVLLIISDDHSFEMGAYGDPVIQTPNLDRMAENGVRFTNNFCTTASCSASRSVIFTGLYNHANGQYGHTHDFHHFSLHSWVKPIPKLLKENGYKTGLIGKFHVEPASSFDFDYLPRVGARNVHAMSARAAEFFEQTKDNPFFLAVAYSDPHRAGSGFGEQNNFKDLDQKVYSPDEVIVPDFLPDNQATREELALYYAAVHRMDQGIGTLMDALEKDGRLQDTLIIYISDNGMAFPGAKTTVYDPGLHLPMIVMSPSITNKGGVNHAMTNYTNLMPTVLDWTGVEPPVYEFNGGRVQHGLHGRSFLNVLNEEEPEGWDEINFSHTFHEITMFYPSRGTRTKQYKYINNLAHEMTYPFSTDLYISKTWQHILKNGEEYFGPRKVEDYLHRAKEELYDIVKDPLETQNLVDAPDHKSILEDMRKKTLDFRRQTRDPWLIGEPGMNPDKEYEAATIKL